MSSIGNGGGAGTGFFIGVASLFFIVLSGIFVAGAFFGANVLFDRYDGTFDKLRATDILLGQQLYNGTRARQIKDVLLNQQIDQLTAQWQAEILIRLAEHAILQDEVGNETAARIESHEALGDAISNETAARLAEDAILAEDIANVTMMVEMGEAFDAYTLQQLMIKMANITRMENDLYAEIAARIAKDNILSLHGALADSTIAYLQMKAAKNTHERTIKDTLLTQQIAAIVGVEYVTTINGQLPVNREMIITSPNNLTTMVESPGQLLITNNGIRTINTVMPDTTGEIGFSAGMGMIVDTVSVPPYTWRISATGVPIVPNYFTTSASYAGMWTGDGDINTGWFFFPCVFPAYNGNNCGWTAPDNGTYIVQVNLLLPNVVANQGLAGGNNIRIAMAVGTSDFYANSLATRIVPESSGSLYALDSTGYGDWTAGNNYGADIALSGTIVVAGTGMNTAGCMLGSLPQCGYGVSVWFKSMFHSSTFIPAATVTLTAIKVN